MNINLKATPFIYIQFLFFHLSTINEVQQGQTIHHRLKIPSRRACNTFNSKRKSQRIKHQFGVRLSCNTKEPYELDKHNGNYLWTLLIEKEITKPWRDYFECFRVTRNSEITQGYQKTPLRKTAVKYDERYRARFVVD